MQVLKIILLLISFAGYYLFFKKKTEIKEEFIPILVFSTIGVIEFLAGILNFMKLATIFICGIGILFFIKEFYIIIKNKEKIKCNFKVLIFIILALAFLFILKDKYLIHYDNFSHWGMIVKEILLENRLPNFKSTQIIFTAYPPGTACFIYYICKFIGSSEGMMLFAQSLLILAGLYTFLVFCDKNKIINYVYVIIMSIYLLIGNIFIDQLLVDTIIPIMALSSLCIIITYKTDSKKALVYNIPILSLLMIVKNSSVFFIIIDLVVWFIYFIKNAGIKNIYKQKYILLILLPFILMFLWSCHTKLVFDEPQNSKHAMSISNYANTFKSKENSDFNFIFEKMIEKMTSLENKENEIILISALSFVIMFALAFKNKEKRNNIICYFVLFLITYILYQVSLYCMYLFSMPINEARTLSGYSRYYSTVSLFLYGISVITILNFEKTEYEQNSKIKNIFIKMIFLILIVFPVILYRDNLNLFFCSKQSDSKNSLRYEIVNIKEKNNIEEKKSYLIYISNDKNVDADYLTHMCEYEFRTINVKIINNFDELRDMNEIFDYDYFILLRKDEKTLEFINIIKGDINQDVIRFR